MMYDAPALRCILAPSISTVKQILMSGISREIDLN